MARSSATLAALAAALSFSAASAGSPTCALNGTACPPPNWAPNWNLTTSTICQPGGANYFVPPANQPWGLVSLDWSVAESIWLQPNRMNSTCEATSVEGCRKIVAANPGSRCFIYHNMELALQVRPFVCSEWGCALVGEGPSAA